MTEMPRMSAAAFRLFAAGAALTLTLGGGSNLRDQAPQLPAGQAAAPVERLSLIVGKSSCSI